MQTLRSWRGKLKRPRVPPTVKGIFALLRLLPKVSPAKAALGGFSVLAAALLPVAVAAATGLLIGATPAALRGGISSPSGHHLIGLLPVVGVLVLAQQAVSPLLLALGEMLGREVDRDLQERVMAAVGAPTGIAHLTDPEVLAGLRLVRGLGLADIDRPSLAVGALGTVIPAWLRALAAAAILLWFHWWIGLVWLVTWPVVVHYMQREYFRVGQVGYEQSAPLRQAEYLRDLATTGPAAKELRLWGMLDWLVARFEIAWGTAVEPISRQRRPHARVVLGCTGTLTVVNFLSYGLLAWAAAHGELELAGLAIYTQALGLANNYTAFDDQNAYLSFAAASVPKVMGLGARVGTRSQPAPSAGEELPTAFPAAQIRLSDVRFRYPGSGQDALKGINLRIDAGHSLAIVGDNGAGKSSLVKVLCRLYAPAAGTIEVDGRDLSDTDPEAWRARIGVLFQDFAKYHLSAAENISMGAPQYAGDQQRLRAAAVRAGALELIEDLPNGWDTILSPEYTGGTDLSGGQWQRIALARSMFAVDAGARLLILDEPTAALDVRAEAELYERFLELTAGLTTILISHRFSTVRCAERIVVLDQGAVVEDGSHAELMAQEGRYARMFELQAARFAEPVADGVRPGSDLARGEVQAGHA
jgi:ATP-binding cassette subfamily B protein